MRKNVFVLGKCIYGWMFDVWIYDLYNRLYFDFLLPSGIYESYKLFIITLFLFR